MVQSPLPAPVRGHSLTLARRWATDPNAWSLAPRFDPVRRWYHRLHSTVDHEVWLLTWLPGQVTELHDHGSSAGAFVVVSGELVEHSLEAGRLRTTRLPASAGSDFRAGHVHRIGNDGNRPAVSVHVYEPALSIMTRYQIVDDKITVVGIDRAGVQW